MIVYHGSRIIVDKPDTKHSRKRVDFGPGFYVTPIKEQAEGVRVLNFDSYSEEWLDFVFLCRRGEDTTDYDIVMGGVANDKVFDTVELYFQKLITKTEALGRLKYEKPNAQICIRSQKIIDHYLHFEGSGKL
jgi:hypothetical protein